MDGSTRTRSLVQQTRGQIGGAAGCNAGRKAKFPAAARRAHTQGRGGSDSKNKPSAPSPTSPEPPPRPQFNPPFPPRRPPPSRKLRRGGKKGAGRQPFRGAHKENQEAKFRGHKMEKEEPGPGSGEEIARKEKRGEEGLPKKGFGCTAEEGSLEGQEGGLKGGERRRRRKDVLDAEAPFSAAPCSLFLWPFLLGFVRRRWMGASAFLQTSAEMPF